MSNSKIRDLDGNYVDVPTEQPDDPSDDFITQETLDEALAALDFPAPVVEQFVTNIAQNETFVTEIVNNEEYVTQLVTQIFEGDEADTYVTQLTENNTFVTNVTNVINANISGKKGVANELATLDANGNLTPSQAPKRTFNVVIDGGGAVITTGVKARIQIPLAWTDIEPVDIVGDHATGDVVLDIWKGTTAEGIAGTIVAGDSICGSAKPTVSNARGVENAAQTGWSKTGNAYDWLYVNVDSVSDFTNLTMAITVVF